MMKKQHLFSLAILALAFVLFGFHINNKGVKTSKKRPYTIIGTIRGRSPKMIFIAHFDSVGRYRKIDSAQVENGKFSISGELESVTPCAMGVRVFSKTGKPEGTIYSGEFILDSGTTTINCHVDSINKLIAKGTNEQNQYAEFKQKTALLREQINAAVGEQYRLSKSKDKKLIMAATQKYNRYVDQLGAAVLNHVKQYPSSETSALIIAKFAFKQDVNLLQPLYTLLSPTVQQSAFGKVVEQKLLSSDRTAVGKIAPDFSLPDMNGKSHLLSNYRGKFILIDFWASWCGPCRRENPHLLNTYLKYKSKNFEILGISMDSNKKNWQEAVKEDGLPWVHLSDLKANKGEIKSMYGINQIPMNFLLDKDGKIVARNLIGVELEAKLAQLIN